MQVRFWGLGWIWSRLNWTVYIEFLGYITKYHFDRFENSGYFGTHKNAKNPYFKISTFRALYGVDIMLEKLPDDQAQVKILGWDQKMIFLFQSATTDMSSNFGCPINYRLWYQKWSWILEFNFNPDCSRVSSINKQFYKQILDLAYSESLPQDDYFFSLYWNEK